MKKIRRISAAPAAVAVITVLVTVVGAGVKFLWGSERCWPCWCTPKRRWPRGCLCPRPPQGTSS